MTNLPDLATICQASIVTVKHIPKPCRNLFAEVLCQELNTATRDPSLLNVTRLFALPKAVLRAPPRGGRANRNSLSNAINAKLRKWKAGDIGAVWQEAVAPEPTKRGRKPKPVVVSDLERQKRQVINAAQDGQYGKAARILTSDGMHASSDAVVAKMKELHPASDPPNLTVHDDPPPSAALSVDQVRKGVLSFAQGTAPGPSGLRAAHLKESITCRDGLAQQTLNALTNFCNVVAAGKLDLACQSSFCGARLFALKKKDGGVRPVAVGEIYRRLVGKCMAALFNPQAATILQPHQLGVKTSGGCEAIIHALQGHLMNEDVHVDDKWVLLVDFKNAFNTLDRQHMLQQVRLPAQRYLRLLSGYTGTTLVCSTKTR